ncbi:hypothetical protein SDRG_02662 [Saprolegnia diclina VS20]|uniref:Uncharacterized protein n=1 Tax=Saprolegnia diclina (strain VS20) TaxID=1156394 RepID=T0SBA6_SAPDV|nr:hypothetical protein SDRG_02662 [Saprolegnia diclina VS20]EQC40002.1 hypothetical protein SDRG_02662 [Saprolegnia diclina VS20]|eukprot:XP_008606476.1 hypothetical protein SDRG_02662 [Saprolegnia diclina VS20]
MSKGPSAVAACGAEPLLEPQRRRCHFQSALERDMLLQQAVTQLQLCSKKGCFSCLESSIFFDKRLQNADVHAFEALNFGGFELICALLLLRELEIECNLPQGFIQTTLH